MSAQLDPNPIPRHAVSVWSDERRIYLAIPCKARATPFIDAYPLTPTGLGEALAKIRSYNAPLPPKPIYTPPPQPTTRLAKPGPLSTDARLALAQEIMRKLMITPKG